MRSPADLSVLSDHGTCWPANGRAHWPALRNLDFVNCTFGLIVVSLAVLSAYRVRPVQRTTTKGSALNVPEAAFQPRRISRFRMNSVRPRLDVTGKLR